MGALLVTALALGACGGPAAKPSSGLFAAEPAAAPAAAGRSAGRAVRIGSSPEGIVVDARTGLAVIATRNPPELVLFDPHGKRVVRRIPIAGAARHLQVARTSGVVLVPEESPNALLELSLPAMRVRSIAVGAHPHDAAQADGRVFVGDEFGKSLSVIEGSRVVGKIPGFLQPGGVAAVGIAVAVVDVRANTVTLVDARTGHALNRLPAGAGPTHVVAEPDGRLFVIDTRGGAILTYRPHPQLRLASRLALPGAPYGVALDPSRHHLWVTLTAENKLAELDTRTGTPRVIAEYPTGRQPNTVAVDLRTGQVLVADAGADAVQVIVPHP